MYYVTVNVNDRKCCPLAEIVKNAIKLSTMGEIVKGFWEDIPKRFENVRLGEYVIMPNHIHGIVFVGAIHESPLQGSVSASSTSMRMRRKMLLPMIVGRFKMNAAKAINIKMGNCGKPFWERDYFEHIIRDGEDLDRIREYILENPANWKADEYYPENIRVDPLHRGNRDWSALD